MKEKRNASKKKKWIILSGLLALAAAGGVSWLCLQNSGGEEAPAFERLPDDTGFSEGVIQAVGLTAVGMAEEACELGFLEDGLYVEETCLNMGDEVSANSPIFKVSDESLNAARAELEKKEQEAALHLREGKITYETGKIDAETTRDLAAVDAAWAQTVYDSAVKAAQDEVAALEEQTEAAREKVEEYTASITENYYYTYYHVKELEDTWHDNASFLMELYEKWDVDELESKYGGSGGTNGIGYVTNQVTKSAASGTGSSSGTESPAGQNSASSADQSSGSFSFSKDSQEEEMLKEDGRPEGEESPAGGQANISDAQIEYHIYLAMEEETNESKEAYEQALEQYEEAKALAEAGIGKAKSELAVLEAKLAQQKITCEEAVILAKKEYDTAIAENESAQMVYETTIKQLEEDYQTLEEEAETAAENLALFEESVGDGYFYTKEDGVVVMTGVRANTWLTEDMVVLAYSNPDTVSVAASVDQADIASVSVGDEVFVTVSGYGAYDGKITSINPVSSSQSSSSVTYTVNVELLGDVSSLEANLTAYVYIGLSDEEKEMQKSASEGRSQRGEQGAGNDEAVEGELGGNVVPESFGEAAGPQEGFGGARGGAGQ